MSDEQELQKQISELNDRLHLLDEINRLIATNTSLNKIFKNLINECAFRFSPDLALGLLLNDNNEFDVIDAYGCSPRLLPETIKKGDSKFLYQLLNIGGHFTINELKYEDELSIFKDLNIISIECCMLEVKGDPLGIFLLGYKNKYSMNEEELLRFDEFVRASTVAINNAKNKEKIAKYTSKLEELVQNRTKALEIQTVKAEEANIAKSRFLANMSHELRTPLTAIVGYANILNDGILGELDKDQKDAIEAICKSSDHLKILIDDVLNLARIESGKEVSNPEDLSLKSMIEESINLVKQTAKQKNISLYPPTFDEELQNISIYFDKKHFKQIMVNLLSNAIKYTEPNGTVHVLLENTGEAIKVSIQDTGIGIPEEKLKTVFERFERGTDEYSKSQVGTGIGLNLTRKLVILNKGEIGVTSVKGQGSTFYFSAPISTNKKAETEIITKDSFVSKLNGLSIMIIDKDEDSCKIIENVLNIADAKTYTRSTYKNLLEEIDDLNIDLILCDVKIDEENGISFIRQLKNLNSELSKIPVIVVSASAFEENKSSAMQAGASSFIAKPFKPINLINTIRQLTLNRALN